MSYIFSVRPSKCVTDEDIGMLHICDTCGRKAYVQCSSDRKVLRKRLADVLEGWKYKIVGHIFFDRHMCPDCWSALLKEAKK